jgi:hypothetical protein
MDLNEVIAILSRTPATLDALLRGLPEAWTLANEGPGTWNAHEVMGHLIHGEKTDWMTRLEIILQHGPSRPFDPFDREAQQRQAASPPLSELLDEFRELRQVNLMRLRTLDLGPEQLELQGTHPAFGLVTAGQLLATWTAHDLTHLVQIGRAMAKRYKTEVGPWAAYLSVMKS